jgi:hypothetical protein
MQVDYAADYTAYNTKETAQFMIASEWNLRNISESVGDGGPVTLFASANTGWNVFNLEDKTRLAGDEWKPHQWDLLRHMMVQGIYLLDDLKALYNQHGGSYNLTSLAGQPISIDYDASRDTILVDNGDLFYPDIKGVDGYVLEYRCVSDDHFSSYLTSVLLCCADMFISQQWFLCLFQLRTRSTTLPPRIQTIPHKSH